MDNKEMILAAAEIVKGIVSNPTVISTVEDQGNGNLIVWYTFPNGTKTNTATIFKSVLAGIENSQY